MRDYKGAVKQVYNSSPLVYYFDNWKKPVRPTTKFIRESHGNNELSCVGIGVAWGENALSLLDNLNIKKLLLVDNFSKGFCSANRVAKRLRKYKNKIIVIKSDSEVIAKFIKNDSLDFVYIDGDHKYKSVDTDINSWWDKVKIGGVMGGHDFNQLDVANAVNENFKLLNRRVYHDSCSREIDWWVIK